MEKYLYAAAVQGIQSFIFQTNVLKDIVGASELVDLICTKEFMDLLGRGVWKKKSQVIAAAGNVRYIFENIDECRLAVREFPRRVMTKAPGITISQAVVKYNDEQQDSFKNAVDEAEKRLRAQRNRIQPPVTAGLLGMRRAPGTGLPAVEREKDGSRAYIDASTKSKREINSRQETKSKKETKGKQENNNTVALCMKSFYGSEKNYKFAVPLRKRVPFEISDICSQNDWIAVIHADGNSLGQVVRHVGHNQDNFRKFSTLLNNSTIQSANDAFRSLEIEDGKNRIPIRPIVLGGDDMTVIIRGDLAIPYVREFIRCFERHTGEHEMAEVLPEGMTKLTACAGVAFIKSSFPFYYGYRLAESLCDAAKKQAKAINEKNVPSCLMFHKVQDSFVESYADITKRELTTAEGLSFQYGPYFLRATAETRNFGTIEELEKLSNSLGADDEEDDDLRPAIRKWLGLLHENTDKAKQWLRRVTDMHSGAETLINDLTKFSKRGNAEACIAYDALAFNTIMRQVTKEVRHDN